MQFVKTPFSAEESLSCLESYVHEWFTKNFKELTPPQKYSFTLISQGKNLIITAPTGSGKTLAGFMAILNELFKLGRKKELKEVAKEVLLMKGNHDNFLQRIAFRNGIELFDELELGRYIFIHGHVLPKKQKNKFLIIGHEHPAIALYDEIRAKKKINCFLYGSSILVLPAFLPLMQGSEVNVIPKSGLLSPVLRKCDVDELTVIGTSEETGRLKFPMLKDLRT